MRFSILAKRPVTLTKAFYDEDGTQADAGATTISITDANGDVVLAETAATKTGSAETTEYNYNLPAQADVSLLYVTWESADLGTEIDVVEVLGANLFSMVEARTTTITGLQTPLSDVDSYPTKLLNAWRLYISDAFEQRTGQSFVPRYARVELPGNGTRSLWLGDGEAVSSVGDKLGNGGETRDVRRLISVTINGVAQNVDNFRAIGRTLYAKNGIFPMVAVTDPLNVVVEYEYGRFPVPSEANRNGLRLLLANAVSSDIPSRATSFNNEDGTFRLSVWPVEVEAFIKANDRRGFLE